MDLQWTSSCLKFRRTSPFKGFFHRIHEQVIWWRSFRRLLFMFQQTNQSFVLLKFDSTDLCPFPYKTRCPGFLVSSKTTCNSPQYQVQDLTEISGVHTDDESQSLCKKTNLPVTSRHLRCCQRDERSGRYQNFKQGRGT